jgi:hypothetical protein
MTKAIKIVLWHGTSQETHFAKTYREAMRLVDKRHSNTHDPAYYDADSGERLYDSGFGLATESGTVVF